MRYSLSTVTGNLLKGVVYTSLAYSLFIVFFTFLHEFGALFTSQFAGNAIGLIMAVICIELVHKFHKKERVISIDKEKNHSDETIISTIHLFYNKFFLPNYITFFCKSHLSKYWIFFVIVWCFSTVIISWSVFLLLVLSHMFEIRVFPFGLLVIITFSAMEAIRWEATVKGEFGFRSPDS